jgi:hypothetical protein
MNDHNSKLKFERRPSPVLPEHRPLYKIGQLLLILKLASRAGKSSLPRLHLFNWALKRSDRQDLLEDVSKTGQLNVTAWGFDPALAIALRFAVAEDLVRTVSNGYEITSTGELFVDDIVKDPDLFSEEKQSLKKIGKSVTETMVEAVAKGWER